MSSLAWIAPRRSTGSPRAPRGGPAPVRVDGPGRLGHVPTYYAAVAANLARRQDLAVEDPPVYEAEFAMSAAEQRRWLDLFGHHDEQAPFTYYIPAGSRLMLRLLDDIGVNLRHLRHVRSEMRCDGPALQAGVTYRVRAGLTDIVQLRDDRVALIVDGRVFDPAGAVCREMRDSWAVLAVDGGSMARLARSGWLRQSRDAALPGEATARACSMPAGEVHRVTVSGDLGRRYGKISGDRNPVHTSGLVARAFGQRRPFVQGTCTANLVVAHAAARGRLAGLAIDFRRPLFVGQAVEVRLDDDGFDVRDPRGKLAAVGGLCWAQPTSASQPFERAGAR